MSDSDVHVEAAVRRLDEGLNRVGFRTRQCGDRPEDWGWTGKVSLTGEPVGVALDAHFPFSAPIVTLPYRKGASDWHQTTDGVLCLWDAHSKGDQPWLDAAALVHRIEEWVAASESDWPDDAPQLDIEVYNHPRWIIRGDQVVLPVMVINEWADIAGHWFRVTLPNENEILTLRAAKQPQPPTPHRPKTKNRRRGKGRNRAAKYVNGLAVDLGEMNTPLVSTDELVDAIDRQGSTIGELLRAGLPVLVAARYTRRGAYGLIGFWLEMDGGAIDRRCLRVAETGPAQLRRAGRHATALADRRVSVVGAGSVGSYIADILHRSGVRDLHVHDLDVLMPGNVVRHAAPPGSIGAPKTIAVRDLAADRDPGTPVQAAGSVEGLDAAVALLRERDLVVDCTGDRLVWQLFLTAAEIAGARFLHVAVIGHGQFGRVDVCPPLDGASPLPEDDLGPVAPGEWEGGCGDPVSPTPPTAVIETAAMGARFAIRMLTGEGVAPAGESRQLFG